MRHVEGKKFSSSRRVCAVVRAAHVLEARELEARVLASDNVTIVLRRDRLPRLRDALGRLLFADPDPAEIRVVR